MVFLKTIKKHAAALGDLKEALIVVSKKQLDALQKEVNAYNKSLDSSKVGKFKGVQHLKKNHSIGIMIDGVTLHYASTDLLHDVSRFNKLQEKVIQWGYDKEILTKGTPLRQADKTIEEAQEIKDAIEAGDIEEIKDGLGDTLVTLILQAKMQNVSLVDCLEQAYNVIAKREGEMINGLFVKEEPTKGK